jgi:hypothetical protein
VVVPGEQRLAALLDLGVSLLCSLAHRTHHLPVGAGLPAAVSAMALLPERAAADAACQQQCLSL